MGLSENTQSRAFLRQAHKRRKPCPMRLKDVVVTLTGEEAQKVLEIDLDGTPQDALQFIRNILAKKVRESLKTK
ncbi:MAG: hypothetical protein N2260_01020 [Syntrophobacterales bacterium]|nr:hypothetical protein [Syntrophobacterales bacterium]